MILGLGSNCNDRMEHLRRALRELSGSPVQILAVSPVYESDALLLEGSPVSWNRPYLNLGVLCKTNLSPQEVLSVVKEIEKKLGRRDRGRWGPREIDIDILASDDCVLKTPELEIPHAGLLLRPFALLPLADLQPDWKFPVKGPHFGKTADELSRSWRTNLKERVPSRTQRTGKILTEWMGILNLTPDSFSDGGRLQHPDAVIQAARQLIEAGATVLDLGAESTRPGALKVDPISEWERIAPALDALQPLLTEYADLGIHITLSIDTRHAAVAAQAVQHGIHWLNDVTGFEAADMFAVAVDSRADLVFMHSLGVPPSGDKVLDPQQDPVSLLLQWAEQKIEFFTDNGIDRSRLIFDPGIGFGKTPEQTLQIFREIHRFRELGVRILVGHSRKSFMTQWTRSPAAERDPETAALSHYLISRGVDYLRVHDVAINSRIAQTALLLQNKMIDLTQTGERR